MITSELIYELFSSELKLTQEKTIMLLVLDSFMNNRQAWEQEELEQSQIINQRFKELLRTRDAASESGQVGGFSEEERAVVQKRFQQLCQQGDKMGYQQFRRGLGLLGREDSFICRIFNLIDEDGDGYIGQENYLDYLRIILKGNQLQKSRFGWLILTEGRGDIEFKDFMQLFQEISVVWNALTGEIVTPRRRYIQELFNTFDVDQDQTITFSDFRLFFNEHLQFFGWFEYFNNMEVSEESSRAELQKVRQKLRSKLKLQPEKQSGKSPQELRLYLQDSQKQLQRKLYNLTTSLKESGQYIRRMHRQINQAQIQANTPSMKQYSTDKLSQRWLKSSSNSGMLGSQTTDDSVSLRSLYKYNFSENVGQTPINKIQQRKQKFRKQSRNQLNVQVVNQLKGFLESSYKMMEVCQQYRAQRQRQSKFSPTKLKQMEAKLKLFDIDDDKKNKKGSGTERMSVYFGHQNWNLVLNIMVGLRQSIKSLYQLNLSLQIKQSHFQEQHQFFLGNKGYLSGKGPQALKSMENFLFIQKAPIIFQRLRNFYGISNIDYQRSVGPQYLLNQLLTGDLTALNQKCSTGKSGAFFYLTTDNKVFLKTIKKDQYVFFTRILKNYYEHMINNGNTLIVRVYGLYKLKVYSNKQKINTIYFISMENIFHEIKQQQGVKVQEIYDIKGSLYGRMGEDGKQLKDQDWMERSKKISLKPQISAIFKDQIKADSKFFKKNNINDYSLMIAFVKHNPSEVPQSSGNVFKSLRGGVPSKTPGQMMVLTIIDFLTVFEARKNLQYIFKSTFLSKDVSCIPPSDYCQRFRDFVINSVQ